DTSTTFGDGGPGAEPSVEGVAGVGAGAAGATDAAAPGRCKVRHAVASGAGGPSPSISAPSQARWCSQSTDGTNRKGNACRLEFGTCAVTWTSTLPSGSGPDLE